MAFTLHVTFRNEVEWELILESFREFCRKQDLRKKKFGGFKINQYSATLFLSPGGDLDCFDLIVLGHQIRDITQAPL